VPALKTISDEDLLDLTLDAFADSGFDGTSVRDLCRRLGVSHNLIHERFGSKERLWYAAVDHGFWSLAAQLLDAANPAPGRDPADLLRDILIRYVEVTAERPALIRVVNQEAAHPGPRLDYIFANYVSPAHYVADAVLRELERSGRARRISPAALHFLIGHGAGGIVSAPAFSGKFGGDRRSLLAQAREAVDVVLRGILSPA
jgi:TetR/AcrR family transcriptional regulator